MFSRNLNYPVFIIENDRVHKYTGFNIVHGPTGYSAWGRVPNSMKYQSGQVFDAGGRVYEYSGASGFPRFSPTACLFLDNLLIPGFLSKILEKLSYFGPKLTSEKQVGLEEFKKRIFEAIAAYGSKDTDQLACILSEKSNFPDVLEGIEWWRYNGGSRDQDGHPV